ncbi:Transmembrane protein 184B isoform a [Fasciola hepatica]|uniref:Transmembrane protein 184B isoform a n=1 Tax=Fasciola hepatica TaxID=6192 RepID=A0A4E0RVC9_FASHE|nr:Transmembrane protein 184B isoform a [Fasciola hepatica]
MNSTFSSNAASSNATTELSGFITNVTSVRGLYQSESYPTLTIVSSVYVQLFSVFCAFLACFISLHQIYCHLKHYTCFSEQRYIVRILTIVPAYSVYSFTSLMLALHARVNSTFVEPIHDIAEAIYCFLALCYQYLGGEGSIMLELNGKTIGFFYGTCCFAGKPYTILFLRFCKVATLQYTFIKPFTSILSIVLLVVKKYTVGDFNPTSGYLYLFLINNLTVTLALYGLLLFYFATREQLRPFSPILKFATIKAIIFFSFWQDVLFSILEWTHVIHGTSQFSAILITTACKNVLICFELVLTAIALRYAFPYSIYVMHHPPRLVLEMPDAGSDWTTGLGDPGTVDFKPQTVAVNKKLQTLRTDLLVGTAAFTDRVPGQGREPSLPWDIADPHETTDDDQLEHTVWDSRSSGAPLASISAGLKSSIDPRDIFVDAVHNFHPNYRHYTQTRLDDVT